MTISLQDFATGDTNYIAKMNSNNDVLESAVDALQAATSGAAASTISVATAYNALFGTAVALIGDDSYACSDAGGSPAGNLTVASGYCYRPSLDAVLSKTTSTTLGFNGQSAATYYVVIDATGNPTRDTSSTEAIYSIVWTGSAFGAITRLANVVWGAADWLASQSSSALSTTYTSLDDRLEAIETAGGTLLTSVAPFKVLAGPTGGSPTNELPTFRLLVPSDLPTFVGDTGGSPNSSLQGAVPVSNQGDAAAGKFLKADGTWAAPTGSGGTVTSVNLTQPAAGITVSGGPVISSGSITLALANDLSALEGLSSTGFAKRTGTDTWSLSANIAASDFASVDGNQVLAGPTAGSPTTAAPTFRALVQADLPAQPYDVGGAVTGVPSASAVLIRYPFPRAVVFPSSLTLSKGVSAVAATAQTDFDILKNGVSFGTMRFAGAATTASFISASGASFAAGDILTVVAPASPDATLSDVGFSLAGTR
jgi:hypothetical protein